MHVLGVFEDAHEGVFHQFKTKLVLSIIEVLLNQCCDVLLVLKVL